MRLLFIFIFIIAVEAAGISQSTIMRSITDLSDQYNTVNYDRNLMMGDANVEGSPYLAEGFIKGEVVLADSISYYDIPLRYNIYNDRIEFQTKEEQVLEIDIRSQSCSAEFGPHHFISADYIERGKEKFGFLELLEEGHISLYKKYIVTFKEATETKGFQDAQPNRFVRQSDEYLLAIDQGMPETFRSKALLEILMPLCPDIETYKKSEKLKLRQEEDLIRLISYCNNELK